MLELAMGRILVACEYSGVVRDAFIVAGHDAISCDLLPTESPGPHVQGDVRPLLRERWGLVIAHPPCTYLSAARARWAHNLPGLVDGINLFVDCLQANSPCVAVENPRVFRVVRRFIGEPDCYVEPFHFGDPYRKRTHFWLRGLPPLVPKFSVPPPGTVRVVSGSYGKNPAPTLGLSGKRAARFWPGIARAMVEQWGPYVP